MSHLASSSDADESFDDSYVIQQPKQPKHRLTMTLQKATNEMIEETSEEESDCTDAGNSPPHESAGDRLEAMNAEEIYELIDKLGMNDAKSNNSEEENAESEENNMIVDSDEEESTGSGQRNQKNSIKEKKAVKHKIKEEILSKEGVSTIEVNKKSDEQDNTDKKVVKPKRGKKNDEIETEMVQTNTRNAKSKITKHSEIPSEENNISKNSSKKRAPKNTGDIQDPKEESDMKVKPVNKGRGKAKPNHEVEDETSKVKDTKAKGKTTKAPTNKNEVKAIKETEHFADTEKENKKPQKKTKPTSKEAIENEESETDNKVDGNAEEVSVTRKRLPRKNNAHPVEPEVRSDRKNEETTKKKGGKSKETEKVKIVDEPKNNGKTTKTAKSSEVEKPKDSKKAQDAEPKPRAKKAAETQPVLPKRSTRNKKE